MEISAQEKQVFSAVTLTASYETSGATVSEAIEVRPYGQYTLLPIYAQGAAETGNTVEVEIAFSADGTNWCFYGAWIDPGTGQLTERQYFYNVSDTLNQPIVFAALGRYMRIRVKEEGVASNAGTLSLYLYSRPL